jgi:hypothetical protein
MSHLTLEQEVNHLAKQLFGDDIKKVASFTKRLTDTCNKAQGKDFLLIHNPGGWGTTHLENLLQWERSIVEGVSSTIERLGYSRLLVQYFRTNKGWRELLGDAKEQTRFFTTKAKIMAAELRFITQHLDNLKIVIIGVSQGAAFSNAVLQHLDGSERVFSIELGTPFPYKSRRVVTKKTLALDSNGLMPDALMEWHVPTIFKTYFGAPFRWLKYKLQRKQIKFTYCINVPGHDYNWDYPEVQRQVEEFLNLNFGNKHNVEEEVL